LLVAKPKVSIRKKVPPKQVSPFILLAPCIHSIKLKTIAIFTAIGLLPLLSACASPTHKILAENHSKSSYRYLRVESSVLH
jgi:hypothetical protein